MKFNPFLTRAAANDISSFMQAARILINPFEKYPLKALLQSKHGGKQAWNLIQDNFEPLSKCSLTVQ